MDFVQQEIATSVVPEGFQPGHDLIKEDKLYGFTM